MRTSSTILAIVTVAIASPVAAEPFAGLSIGVQGGIARRLTSFALGGVSLKESDSAAAYGAFIGYDRRVGRAVLGVQAEIDSGAGEILATSPQGISNSVDPKWGYALSARAGVLATPQTLIYARAGYAAERFKEVYGGPTILVYVPVKPEWRGGLQIGGGVEQALSERIALRAEYRHNDYSSRYEADQFLVGAAFRF